MTGERRVGEVRVHHGLAVYRFGEGQDRIFFMPGPHRYQRPGLRTADALIAGLTAAGRQVVTFDPPASGRSTRSAHLSMQEMHACADEALAVAGIHGPVDAIGHSMGGLAMLAYALERPERVRRLILVGTGSGGPAYMRAPGAIQRPGHPDFLKVAALGILQTIWPRRAPARLTLNVIQRASFVDRSLARPMPVTVADWFRPMDGRPDWHWIARRLDYAPRLGELAGPALILVGRHDPQFPISCSEALADRINRSHLVVFERSGHYPFIEEPEAFWAAVRAFLDAPVAAAAEVEVA